MISTITSPFLEDVGSEDQMISVELRAPNGMVCSRKNAAGEDIPSSAEEIPPSSSTNDCDGWEMIPNPLEISSVVLQNSFLSDLNLVDPSALAKAQDVFITLNHRSPLYNARRAALCQSVCFHEPYKYDRLVKLHLIGDRDVGKTAMLHRLVTEEYLGDRTPHTHCVDFSVLERILWDPVYRVANSRPQQFRIHMFDVAGFHGGPVTSLDFRGCHGIFLCFSVSDRESFKSLESHWLPLIREYAGENVAMILVGMKCDVDDSNEHTVRRQVTTSEAQLFAHQILVPYLECSARNGIRVDDCLATLLHHVAIRLSDANDRRRRQIAKTESLPLQCSVM